MGCGSLKQDLSSLTRDQTQAMEVKVPNPNHQTMRPRWFDAGPWCLSALKKDFSKEVKSSETSNVLIRREDTCRESTGRLRERESCTLNMHVNMSRFSVMTVTTTWYLQLENWLFILIHFLSVILFSSYPLSLIFHSQPEKSSLHPLSSCSVSYSLCNTL